MYFKHDNLYYYKNLADLTIKKQPIGLVSSIILGACIYILVSFIIYPEPLVLISSKLTLYYIT